MQHPDYRVEGEWFVRRRMGNNEEPWGLYQRIGGQDIRFTSFRTEQRARDFLKSKTK